MFVLQYCLVAKAGTRKALKAAENPDEMVRFGTLQTSIKFVLLLLL